MVATWLPGVCVAAASWMMAEYFTRTRRMALPSILLVATFAGALGVFGFTLTGIVLSAGSELTPYGMFAPVGGAASRFASMASGAFLIGFLFSATGALVHWRRFHVPVTVALLSSSALSAMIALGTVVFPDLIAWHAPLTLICGLLLFAVALRWDASDVERRTRRSDVAFWLHLVAAPLMVRPMFEMLGLTSGGDTTLEPVKALLAIGCYAALAAVALVIDRRALLLSALIYVLYAISSLLALTGLVTAAFAVTGLVIGTTLLLLSVWWRGLRTPLVRALPAWIRANVPA